MWWRVKGFVAEAVPIVLGGVLIVNILYTLGFFDFIANLTAPVVTTLLGLPKEAVGPIVIGFLRKDVAVGMLIPLELSVKQLIVSSVILSMFFPCIATFTILLRELGWKGMLGATTIMIFISLFVGSFLNLVL